MSEHPAECVCENTQWQFVIYDKLQRFGMLECPRCNWQSHQLKVVFRGRERSVDAARQHLAMATKLLEQAARIDESGASPQSP